MRSGKKAHQKGRPPSIANSELRIHLEASLPLLLTPPMPYLLISTQNVLVSAQPHAVQRQPCLWRRRRSRVQGAGCRVGT